MYFLQNLTTTEWLIIIGALTSLMKFLEAILKVDGPVTLFLNWLFKPIIKTFSEIKSIKTSIENLEASGKDRDTQLSSMSSQVEEIHHEVRLNSGSSIKDSVLRNESGLKNLTILVKRMCRQALATDDTDLRMRFTMDANLNCIWVNKTYLETFNLQESDVENRNWQAKAIHPDDLNIVVEKWKNASAGKSRYDNIQRNYIRSTGEDKYIKCRVRAVPVMDEDGNLVEFMGTVDIV